jgi:glycosyltransferase involved in cell wall biosynthesis
MTPAVSIILPTYDRARFLPEAFSSILAQTWTDWQLIVVDDGSTDDTREVVAHLASQCQGRVDYVHQANRGAAAARNTGLDRATGAYVAFFDSDDLWLPDYLARSVAALEANPDVDWVFGPCRMVDLASGRELESTTFRRHGKPRRFLELRTESRTGDLQVIVDSRALEFQIQQGMTCGPQNSVYRRRLFERRRFVEELRVGEDQVFAISALADRRRLAYFLEPRVIYRVHNHNSSLAGGLNEPPERFIQVFGTLTRVLERLRLELPLNAAESRALRKRVAADGFWQLGYNGLWRAGRRVEAVAAFSRSLRIWPWTLSRWRTFFLAKLRLHLGVSHS